MKKICIAITVLSAIIFCFSCKNNNGTGMVINAVSGDVYLDR